MGKGYLDLTPEQRAAAAERARSLKLFGEKHGLKDAQQRMRLIGEKLGLKQCAEDLKKLREAETAPPMPQEPTPPQRKARKRGAGRKPSLQPEQIEEGIRILLSHKKMKIEAARKTLRDAGIDASDTSLYDHVIRPANRSRSSVIRK